MLVKHPFF